MNTFKQVCPGCNVPSDGYCGEDCEFINSFETKEEYLSEEDRSNLEYLKKLITYTP